MSGMRTRYGVWLWVVVFGAVCAAVQTGDKPSSGEEFLGTWIGTWDGAGTGGFELTLEQTKDGALGGRVSVTGEPAYRSVLKTVEFAGKKMNAKYDFTPDERGEVVLDLTAAIARRNVRVTHLVTELDAAGQPVIEADETVPVTAVPAGDVPVLLRGVD